MSDLELERALAQMGAALDWPAEPDLAPAVGARIRQELPRRVQPRQLGAILAPVRFRGHVWQLAAAAVVVLVVAFSAVVAISPGVRNAVAGWLGVRGIEIQRTPTPPPAPIRSLGAGLDLGRQATIQQAERASGFTVRAPATLGPPDTVYVHPLGGEGDEIFLVYHPRPGLPESTETGVGALLSEFRGDVDRAFLKKIGSFTQTTFVKVNGNSGFWIQGPHDVLYVDPDGNLVPDTLRLSGSVLVWEQGGLTYRLESALTLDQALAIARSVR